MTPRHAKPKQRGNGDGDPYPIRDADEKIVGYAFTLHFTIDGVARRKKVERRITRNRTAAQARAEVRAEVTRLRERLTHGDTLRDATQSLDVFLDDWLTNHYAKKREPKSVATYTWARQKIAPLIGNEQLTKLTPRRLDRLFLTLAEPPHNLQAASIRIVRAMLKTAFAQAKKWGMVPSNPVSDTDAPAAGPKRAKRIDPADALALVNAARVERLGLAVVLALALGLRRAEVCGLRWSDIDLVAGRLTVNGQAEYIPKRGTRFKAKSKSEAGGRTMLLPASIVAALDHYRAQLAHEREAMAGRWVDSPYVFVAPTTGDILKPDALYTIYRRIAKRAGVSGYRLHDTRHTVASDLNELGVDDKTIADLLGHASPQFTQKTYIHSSDHQIADATHRRAFLLTEPEV